MEAITETEIRDALRHQQLAQQAAIGADTVHTIGGTAPEVAMFIHPETIGPAWCDLVEQLATGDR